MCPRNQTTTAIATDLSRGETQRHREKPKLFLKNSVPLRLPTGQVCGYCRCFSPASRPNEVTDY